MENSKKFIIEQDAKSMSVALKDLEPCPFNSFETDDYAELKGSISTSGLIVPLTVIGPQTNGKYQILSGERRFRAISELVSESDEAAVRFESIPCYVLNPENISEIEQKIIMETSNLETREFDKNAHRLNVVALVKRWAEQDCSNMKRKVLLDKIQHYIGGSDRYTRMYYDIFDKGIDDLNEAVKRGDINIDAAARLANQPEETQKDILNEIAKRQVNAPTDEDENPKIQQKATSNFILEQIEQRKEKTDGGKKMFATTESSPVGGAISEEFIDKAMGDDFESLGDDSDDFGSELDPESLEGFFNGFEPDDDISQDPSGVTAKHGNPLNTRTSSLDTVNKWIETMYKKQSYSEEEMETIDQLRDLITHVDEIANTYLD